MSITPFKLWHPMSAGHSGMRPVSCQWSLVRGTIHTTHCTTNMSKNPQCTTCGLLGSYKDHIPFKTQMLSWRGIESGGRI